MEPPKHREIPQEPEARAAALKTVESEVALCLGLADMIAARLPPNRPLAPEEKAAISDPLAQVLYKYGGQIPCEWQLIIACGFVAAGRYAEFKQAQGKQGKLPGV